MIGDSWTRLDAQTCLVCSEPLFASPALQDQPPSSRLVGCPSGHFWRLDVEGGLSVVVQLPGLRSSLDSGISALQDQRTALVNAAGTKMLGLELAEAVLQGIEVSLAALQEAVKASKEAVSEQSGRVRVDAPPDGQLQELRRRLAEGDDAQLVRQPSGEFVLKPQDPD